MHPRSGHHHDDEPFSEEGPRRARHGGRFGFGPWFGPPFGGPFRGAPGHGGRARRGDVRAAILALLSERPMHGYEIIQELVERTGGVWRPSPGSVYPTLQLLEDEGMVTHEEDRGKRSFSLTDEGRAAAAELSKRAAPWEEVTADLDPAAFRLRDAVIQLFAAVGQIARAGSPEQQAEAETILAETRRRLYALLAREA